MSLANHRMYKVPLSEVAVPKGGMRNCYVDQWWPVSEDECIYIFSHPKRVLYGSPQTNMNKSIVERLAEDFSKATDQTRYSNLKEVRQIPFVSFPVDISDYV